MPSGRQVHPTPKQFVHVDPLGQPVVRQSSGGGAHAPADASSTPARCASHALSYVTPSQPHTGALGMPAQSVGLGMHVPDASVAPQSASGA